MKITTGGRVTIPKDIREKAGLLPNTEVKFVYARGIVTLVPVCGKQTRGALIAAALRGSAKYSGMTTDELMALTRGEI